MKIAPPPTGFTLRALPCGVSWLRPEWAEAVAMAAGASSEPIIARALASPGSTRFVGRGAVASWSHEAFARPVVVRRCRHGGWWRHLAGDRYRGEHRARREIDNAERLRSLGVPTPEIVGAVFYPAGAFRRMDLITVQVAQGRDLVEFLAAAPAAPRRDEALAAARRLLERCAAGGAHHRDLNARNILLAPRAGGDAVDAWLLDVEDIAWMPERADAARRGNHARLTRSLRKRVRRGDLRLDAAQLAAVIAALEARP